MAKYDWNTFRNYIAFLAGRMAPGTRRPHHDSELTSCYHDAFLTWGHYHNNIVLFYHDSPITRSHFMDPTDRAIKGFYCSSTLQDGVAGIRPFSHQKSRVDSVYRHPRCISTCPDASSRPEVFAICGQQASLSIHLSTLRIGNITLRVPPSCYARS